MLHLWEKQKLQYSNIQIWTESLCGFENVNYKVDYTD